MEEVDVGGEIVKRLAIALLLVAMGVPLAAQAAPADILRATGVVTSSKSWVVTLSIAKTALRTGSSMSATITVRNRTGHDVKISGCPGDQVFVVGLGNRKVPYAGISSGVACSSTLHRGINIFHERVRATYQVCGGSGNLPCPSGGGMPDIPPETYHTVVRLPITTPTMPKAGILWVNVTK